VAGLAARRVVGTIQGVRAVYDRWSSMLARVLRVRIACDGATSLPIEKTRVKQFLGCVHGRFNMGRGTAR
jgi:hypothetical protein